MHYTRGMAEAIGNNWWALILLGLFVGTFAGLFGLGGGVIMVPLLVLILGFSQREAQGTSLAMILSPFQAPGIWEWHRKGQIEWKMVWFMAPSLFVGSWLGAKLGGSIPQAAMRVVFALVLTYIAAYMIFSKLDMTKGFALAAVPVIVTLGLAWASGVFDAVAKTVDAEGQAATATEAGTEPVNPNGATTGPTLE